MASRKVPAKTGLSGTAAGFGPDAALRAEASFAAGNFADARQFYESQLALTPDHPELLYRLGVIYGGIGLLDKAERMLARAAAAQPNSAGVINAQANVAWLQSSWPRAEQLFHQALALEPGNVSVLANLGLCLHDAGRLNDAREVLLRALEMDAVHPDALVNAALVLLDLGEPDDAQALLSRAIQTAPDFPEAHALHAQFLLQRGDYANGWAEYEWRLRCGGARYREDVSLPRWDGAEDGKRSLVIYAEQGIGDQIMFASCLPDVLSRVSDCAVECDPKLVELFARSFPRARFHAQTPALERQWAEVPPHTARQIHCGSLPKLFRNRRDQFPDHAGYLKTDPVRRAFWSEQLAMLGNGLKVGVVWRGGVPRTRQTMRSVSLAQWMPLLQTPGARFVSLQHGHDDDELDRINASRNVRIEHWPQALDDCDETAALIAELDVVICVCGSVVHLAGAVGKSAWVMVPACPEWRYMATGEVMPWYPSVRLFRQANLGDWSAPIEDIRRLLFAAGQRHNATDHI